MPTSHAPLHVVIAGGGFAGLRVARSLARNGPRRDQGGRAVRVTLVDRNEYFTYTPLLYNVAAGEMDAAHVAPRYRDLLWDDFVAVRQAAITGIDIAGRALHTNAGLIAYDRLVLALGSVANPPAAQGAPAGLEGYTLPFMTLPDAIAIRERLRRHCLRRVGQPPTPGDLTVVVVGGGPRGVELIFDLADYLERRLVPEYGLDRARLRLVLIAGEDRLMHDFPPGFERAARDAMSARGIRLLLERYVVGATRDRVLLGGGQSLATQNVIWAAGFAPHPLLRDLGAPVVDGGVAVTASLHLPGHPELFIAGDGARALDAHGKSLPATASLAQQHGRFIGRALAADLRGQPLPRFQYVPRGNAVRFGADNGYAQLGAGSTLHLHGPAAATFRAVFDVVELPGLPQKRGAARNFLGVPGS